MIQLFIAVDWNHVAGQQLNVMPPYGQLRDREANVETSTTRGAPTTTVVLGNTCDESPETIARGSSCQALAQDSTDMPSSSTITA